MPKTQEEIRATNRECVKRWKKTDRGKKKCAEQQSRWRKTPSGIARTKEYTARSRDRVKEKRDSPEGKKKILTHYLGKKYGLTMKEYEGMLSEQGGACAICGSSNWGSDRTRIDVDHDHKTGRVRGLLCHNCNVAIGLLSDSANAAYSAAVYLRGN